MSAPEPKPWILEIAPYIPGRSTTDDGRKAAKLSSNENPLGTRRWRALPSQEAAGRLERYPDASATDLREALAARHGLDPARIIYGNGSDEVLHLAAGAFAGPGDEVIFVHYGFAVYEIAARRVGATAVVAPDNDYATDVDAILACVTDTHPHRLRRQSQQPDRHLHQPVGDRAAPRRAARACAARARSRLCRIYRRAMTTTAAWRWPRPRPTCSSRAPSRRCTASPPSGSAGAMPPRRSSRRCTASACPSRSPSPAPPRRSRRSGTRNSSSARRAHNAEWRALVLGRDRQARQCRAARRAEPGQFRAGRCSRASSPPRRRTRG